MFIGVLDSVYPRLRNHYIHGSSIRRADRLTTLNQNRNTVGEYPGGTDQPLPTDTGTRTAAYVERATGNDVCCCLRHNRLSADRDARVRCRWCRLPRV